MAARSSRRIFLVAPAESVCKPGAAEAPVAAWVGCTTVTAVTVLCSPLAMVEVLW